MRATIRVSNRVSGLGFRVSFKVSPLNSSTSKVLYQELFPSRA